MEPELALHQELRALKRGRGLATDDIVAATGPRLRRLCGFSDGDDPEVLRSRLIQLLMGAAQRLPDDERMVVLRALAIDPAARHRFLRERLQSALVELDRDSIRTVDRKVVSGLTRIAEILTTAENANRYVPNGWFTQSLESTVRLDTGRPELHEHRRIVATRPGLDRVLVSLTAPPDSLVHVDEPGVEIRAGETAVQATELGRGHYQGLVKLGRELREGEPYEYDVTFVLARPAMMRPYYLLTPLQTCREFHLTVRFDLAHPPATVWRIDGVPRGVAEVTGTDLDVLRPDDTGRVSASFHSLHPGLTYGVRWSAHAS